MSGPKLSAYELEQLRKAELEQIQKDTAESRAGILRMQSAASAGIEQCSRQLLKLDRQLDLLDSCTLTESVRSDARNAILSRRRNTEEMKAAWSNYKLTCEESFAALPEPRAEDELMQTRSAETQLKAGFDELSRRQEAFFEDSGYREALDLIAENVKGSMQCTTLSFAEAMSLTSSAAPVQSAFSGDTAQLQNSLLARIAELKEHRLITEKMLDSLDKSARFIEQESSPAGLKSAESMVINDISWRLKKIETLYGAYQSAFCEKQSLLSMLGENTGLSEKLFDSPDEVLCETAKLKSEISALQSRVMAKAERDEIESSIDAAMTSLGYSLIGTKSRSADGSVKLYSFSSGAGIQLTQWPDGRIRMKVVGLGYAECAADAAHTDFLVQKQTDFCSAYSSIVEAFGAKGLHRIDGTEQRRPPDEQFAQTVNVLDYDPEYKSRLASGDGTAVVGRAAPSRRVSIREPIHLTTGE